jgi:hypothetical protein
VESTIKSGRRASLAGSPLFVLKEGRKKEAE